MAKVDNFVSKNWHMECGTWICQTKRDHVKFIMTEGCGHYSLCFFKSLIPILASGNSEHLCNRTILLYPGYTFLAVLMLNLQRQHVYLVYHLSSQPTQLAKHRIFCFQQFGFSSTQQVLVLPVWASEWNVICQPNLVWLSFPFYSWFWLFRNIFLGLWIIVMLAWTVQLPFTGPVFDVVANGLLIFLSALVAFCQVLCQGISKKGLAADGQNKWKISLLSKMIWQ